MSKNQFNIEKNINDLLHKLLGNLGVSDDDILYNSKSRKGINKKESMVKIELMNKDMKDKFCKILLFYQCMRRASEGMKEISKENRFAEHAVDNELLLGLVSIIDWLAYSSQYAKCTGFLEKFNAFLERNLKKDNDDYRKIKKMLENLSIKNKEDKTIKLSDYHPRKERSSDLLYKFGCYVYEIRSYFVHYATLGGMYRYNIDFSISNTMEVDKIVRMLKPEMVRNILWKAVFLYFGLGDICVIRYK